MNQRLSLVGLALAFAVSAASACDDKGFSMGIEGHARATASDVGLPVYAGAVLTPDSQDDKASVSLGAWAGGYGLQVYALKYHAAAPVERVAAFYAKALGRYGEVLDCRDPAARVKAPKDQPDKLSCDGNAPKAGEFEYRVGTAKSFRVVKVKPDGDGSRFDMARIDLRF